jgi:hypothetical protein
MYCFSSRLIRTSNMFSSWPSVMEGTQLS